MLSSHPQTCFISNRYLNTTGLFYRGINKGKTFHFSLKSKLTTMEQVPAETLTLISEYVQQNAHSKNTQLFSFLALLGAYIPDSYLHMDECQQILGPPDPIHGGPPFEEQMEPFTRFISTSSPEGVSVTHPVIAQRAVELLHELRINRSTIVRNLMSSLCGDQSTPHMIPFIKGLLTKREVRENGKEKFSGLISDIRNKEDFHNAVSVLEFASEKFPQNPNFPQTISRLYHNRDTIKAEKWAKEAIERCPNNSFIADTLGQVYKKCLMEAIHSQTDIIETASKAFKAFKEVEMKAEREDSPEMMDMAEAGSMSSIFNNRGLFGFLQVAKITFEELKDRSAALYPNLETEIEDKFDFFEWYLTYSQPNMSTLEPPYFWEDVALCYEYYTNKTAADSTSFPGLLDLLNHGLFMSKGRRAKFEEAEKNVSDLETIQECLKVMYEENDDDIKQAESYILSNVLLSNRRPDSPLLSPMKELQMIIHRFLGKEVASSRPEFYLLVLMLFWPEKQLQVLQEEDDEEVEPKATEDSGSTNTTWEDSEQDQEQDQEPDPAGEPAQLPPDLMLDLDLQKYVTFMENAFEKAKYAKYLRGRYLVPLFFLGKGSGLKKWIHKSRLDAIVEEKVDTEEKEKQINDMWLSGKVWHIAEIRDILLPVQPCSSTESEEDEEQEVFVCAGSQKIKVRTEDQPPESALPPMLFYLGFTIQGPVVFRVGAPHSDCQ